MRLGGERVAATFGWGTIRSLRSIPCGGVAVGACGGCEGWQSRVGLRSIEFWPRPDPPRTTPAGMTSCARFSRHAYRPHRPVAFASLIRSGNGLLWRKLSCPVVVAVGSCIPIRPRPPGPHATFYEQQTRLLFIKSCPTVGPLRHDAAMPREASAIPSICTPLRKGRRSDAGSGNLRSGLCQPCQLRAAEAAPGRPPGLRITMPRSRIAQVQMPQTQMGAGIAAGPHCRRCWHSRFPAPELTASFRRSLPFGAPPPFGRGFLRSAPHSRLPRLAGLPILTGRLVLRRPQFLTTWAWQSLVPLPPLPRCRVRRCCWRVAFFAPPGTAPSGSSLSRLAFGRIPQGKKGPSARLGVLPLAPLLLGAAPGLATIGLAASALLRDAVPASGTGPSGLPSPASRGRLSTLEMVSLQTFRSDPIRKFQPEISALRHLFHTLSPFRQVRCCASKPSRTSSKKQSYPQTAHLLVDNSASCGNADVLVS